MRFYITCFLILFLTLPSYTQEVVNLTGSWINLDLEMKWNDRIDFKLSQSNRFNDIVGTYAVSNTTFKASYELRDWLEVIGGYRYMARKSRSRKFNRYQLALQAKTKWHDIKLSWRTRLEYRKAINRDAQVTRLRNRVTARYKINSLDLTTKLFTEYWYTFDDPIHDFSKYRIGLSLSKEMINQIDTRVGFNYDADLNQNEIERESVVLIGLTYNFNRRKATK